MGKNLIYKIPGASWTLSFSQEALNIFTAHVQSGWKSKESVGQLYTRDLTGNVIEIEVATVLKPTWATFSRVKISEKKAILERRTMFEKGFHCIGVWHTHLEKIPQPSDEDLRFAKDHAKAAQPHLTGIIFVIIGTTSFPDGLAIWVHDGENLHELQNCL